MGDIIDNLVTLSLFDVPSDYVSLFDQNQVAGCHAQFHRAPYPSLSISEEAQSFSRPLFGVGTRKGCRSVRFIKRVAASAVGVVSPKFTQQ